MSQHFYVHPDNPQSRLIGQAVQIIQNGGVIAYPTDSGYALGWRSNNRKARDRVIRLRDLDRHHHFSYCCRSLSEVSKLVHLGNAEHRLIRQLTPGPYTFILPSTKNVSRNAQLDKVRTIGVRIPDHPLVQGLLEVLDEPLLSSSLILPDPEGKIVDTEDLYDEIYGQIDLFVDAGFCPLEPTTLIDLTSGQPVVLRRGRGVIDFL